MKKLSTRIYEETYLMMGKGGRDKMRRLIEQVAALETKYEKLKQKKK